MHLTFRLKDLASYLEGEYSGNSDAVITAIASIDSAGEGDITFLHKPKYAKYLNGLKNLVLLKMKC